MQVKNTKVKVFELAPPATQTELLGDFNSEDMKGNLEQNPLSVISGLAERTSAGLVPR